MIPLNIPIQQIPVSSMLPLRDFAEAVVTEVKAGFVKRGRLRAMIFGRTLHSSGQCTITVLGLGEKFENAKEKALIVEVLPSIAASFDWADMVVAVAAYTKNVKDDEFIGMLIKRGVLRVRDLPSKDLSLIMESYAKTGETDCIINRVDVVEGAVQFTETSNSFAMGIPSEPRLGLNPWA